MGFMKKKYLKPVLVLGFCLGVLHPSVSLAASHAGGVKKEASEIDRVRHDFFALLMEQGMISQPVPSDETLLLLDRSDKCEHGRYLLDFGRGQFNFCSGRSVSNDCGVLVPRMKVVLRSWMGDDSALKSQEVFEYLIDALDLVTEGRKDDAIEALTQVKRICNTPKHSQH